MVFLQLPARSQLSCYFHHFKVIALLLAHFPFGFPCFIVCWWCLAATVCCLLVGFISSDLGQSSYLHVHVPPKSRSFIYLFFSHADHFGVVEHVFSFVLTMSWMCFLSFPPQSGNSSQWPYCLPDQHLILGPCSCSFLNNYMVVTSGKILWDIISYPWACASWVTWDYQVSSKFLAGTLPFAFDVMVPLRQGNDRDWDLHTTPDCGRYEWKQAGAQMWTPAAPTKCGVSVRFSLSAHLSWVVVYSWVVIGLIGHNK